MVNGTIDYAMRADLQKEVQELARWLRLNATARAGTVERLWNALQDARRENETLRAEVNRFLRDGALP